MRQRSGLGRATLALALLAIVILAAPGSPVHAQLEPQVNVSVIPAEPGPITVGDLILVQVRIWHDPDIEPSIPPDPVALGVLDAAIPIVTSEPNPDGRTITTITYETRAFVPGLLTVPVPPVLLMIDGQRRTFAPPPASVDVRSVLPADPSGIAPRPLKPSEEIEGAAPALRPIVVPLVGVVIGFIVATMIRRRLRGRRLPLVAPALDPASAALDQLDALAASGVGEDGVAGFWDRVMGTVRLFLTDRYDVPAANLTSSELPHRLAAAGAEASVVQMVRNLLLEGDRIHYAGERLPVERAERYPGLAAAIIEQAARTLPAAGGTLAAAGESAG